MGYYTDPFDDGIPDPDEMMTESDREWIAVMCWMGREQGIPCEHLEKHRGTDEVDLRMEVEGG